MMRFLLDSSFCIACLRRKPWALQALASVPLASVAISSLTVGELMLGTHLSGLPDQELARVEAFLRPIQVLPFGQEEAVQWARIEAMLRKQGARIEAEDSMIAATAQRQGLTLISGNTEHFERVKGLKIVNWEQHPPKGFSPPSG